MKLHFYVSENKFGMTRLNLFYSQSHFPQRTSREWNAKEKIRLVLDQLPPASSTPLNTLRPRRNGRRFADDTFKCIFINENVRIPIKISLKFVPKGSINNIPALVQIMAWRRPGNKPLSEPMMVSLTTDICITRPQWVNTWSLGQDVRQFADKIFKGIFFNANFRI